jgi:hypothetical protein
MRRTLTTLAALCATVALTAGAAAAQSTPADRTTFVTFSGPVSVPGTTLPAGTYTFKIADSQTDRHIVQIFNREGTKLFTTLLAVPAERNEAAGDPVITFKETPSDRPPAVHYWYYAGEKAGNELVYPKSQAMAIAKASGEDVMSVDSSGTTIDDWKSGSVSRVKADTEPSASSSTTSATSPSTTTASDTTTTQQPTTAPKPTTTPEPTPAPMTAQPTTAPQPTTTPEQPPAQPAPTTAAPTTPSVPPPSATDNAVGTSGKLPHTASELPMVGLIGLFALGAAVAIRFARVA